ncbi:PAS domain-containing protein [Nodularia harveyana UHCC-0300]|uniref:PAS domain-containing protein n=1 Tax=Nodularia harveyana UHCC-0300 TaxID=2974287 RepID=A0ABU5UH00_9CYAN|nr:PAS domain-containing protein [Nodularia harveyana]MEA5582797.1 PAS domain-containing protein [Nodularia harveyana UHCC-0300]
MLNYIHPLDRDHYIDVVDGLLSGKNFMKNFPIIRPDDEMQWIDTKTFPINNQQGEFYRFAGIAENIT